MMPVDLDPPMPIGTIIADRYEVTGFLGRGGMGFVVAARHLQLGERVAIKFLHQSFASLAERFFREARAAAGLESDHVVRIYDAGRLAGGVPYMVMEHLTGEDLAARLESTGSMAPESASAILVDICLALAEAHAAGIVHRDLKPGNIFLARRSGEQVVKLLDFGAAKVPNAGVLTQTGNILGSPPYMSPEQLLGSRDIDHRSDIWSLGVILYELLTDQLPFNAGSLVGLGLLIREMPTPPVRALQGDVPEEMDAVIARCLAKEPTDRYADVGEFAEALAPFLPGGTSDSIPRIHSILRERRRPPAPTPPPLAPTMFSGAGEPVSTSDDQVAMEELPFGSGSGKPQSVTLNSPTSSRPSDDGKRRLLALLASLGLAGVAAVAIARHRPPAPIVTVGMGDPAPSASIASASAQATDVVARVSPPEAASVPPSATISETALVTQTRSFSIPSVRPTHSRPASPAASTPALVSAPKKFTPNCSPPFNIDDGGIRRVKRECL